MKKLTCLMIVLAVFLMTGSGARAVMIDDFESYDVGELETVTTTWFVNVGADTASGIAVDPDNSANKVIREEAYGSDSSFYTHLAEDATIGIGETKTFFFKFKVTEGTMSAIDCSINLTNDDNPNGWSDGRFACSVWGGNFNVRVGGTNFPLFAPDEDVWYSVWAVISHDGTSPAVKLYANSTGAAATEADRLSNATAGDTFGYRSNTTEDLDNFYLYMNDSSSTPTIMLDDLYMTDGEFLSLPLTGATDPDPESGATNIGTPYDTTHVSVSLGWAPPADPNNPSQPYPLTSKYYLYMTEDQEMSSDPNLYYVNEIDAGDPISATPGYGPVVLNMDGLYKWRVDVAIEVGGSVSGPSDPNTITGSVWSFGTLITAPVFTAQPEFTMVDPDATAVFSVTVSSTAPVSYQWYKYVDGVSDTELADGGDISGATTNELSIAHAEAADEGDYYCIANNGSSVQSDSATLIVKRMLAHWKLDAVGGVTDASDDTGNGYNGTLGLPSGVTDGYDGTTDGAWLPDATEPNDIDIPQVISELPDYFTITAWIKTDSTAEQAILSLYDPENDESMRLQLAGGELRYKEYGGGGTSFDTSATVDDGQWHFVSATYDLDEGLVQLYVDGKLDAQRTTGGNTSVFTEMKLGSLAGSRYIVGALDDVILYNYALTSAQIAANYGGEICVANPEYDFDGSCKVDLPDLAVIASHWLDCGLYVECGKAPLETLE